MATTSPSGRRTKRIVLVTAALMLIGGAAFAYWTTTGSGAGSATSGAGGTITVNQTGDPITNVNPGAAPQTLSGTFTNTTGAAYQVTSVTATVSSVVTSPVGGDCEADDYVIAGTATVGGGGAVPIGTGVGSWTGLTIAFVNETAEDQNDCKGATVNIAYLAS